MTITQKKAYISDVLEWSREVERVFSIREENVRLSNWDQWIAQLEVARENNSISEEEVQQIRDRAEYYHQSLESRIENNSVKPGDHKLPLLPYNYNALEPHISEKIMRLHHDKHHQSYVDGLNRAERALYLVDNQPINYKYWLDEQAFNGSGHYLHTIFWFNMSPNGGGAPTPNYSISKQIENDFGSFANFKQQFTEAANSVQGSGWATLVWSPRARRLAIQTLEKHQNHALADTIPLLVLDVWEHAYYLQYDNERSKYVQAWWNVVNWDDVDNRFNQSWKLKWKPF